MTDARLFYRKQKLRGACWEYQIDGGWMSFVDAGSDRQVLHHQFSFYRPREVQVNTAEGVTTRLRWGAEQWFFPDRWFSLLRFVTEQNETVGYYVNFSRPLLEIKANRDEFDEEIANERLQPEWATAVNEALQTVSRSVTGCIEEFGPDLDCNRDTYAGLPIFIVRA
jgi:hypothetical protein